MNVGIIGLGVVGKAVSAYHEKRGDTVYTYDKTDKDKSGLAAVNKHCEVVFICVGTPYDKDTGVLDCSAVFDAVGKLEGDKTVIIKSTVMPGTTDKVQEQFPQHRVWFIPEFLSEKTAVEDYAHPRRPHVIGSCGPNPLDEPWLDILPDAYIDGCCWYCRCLPAYQAELLKLATNAFYAMKVTFANELASSGMEQATLDALAADPWIAASHFDLDHAGYRGFGGKCLVKDAKALSNFCYNGGVVCGLVWTICLLNKNLLAKQGKSEDEWL